MDHDGVVFVERLDGLATVVLNRPDKLNALNKEMWARLGPIFIDLHNDETCLLYTSPSPRDLSTSRMPSSA